MPSSGKCAAGEYKSGAVCAKCPAGRTTGWRPKAAGYSAPWVAPIAGYSCNQYSSYKQFRIGAGLAACQKRCSAAACAGIMFHKNYACYICMDASKGGASSSWTIHRRTAIGASAVAECSVCAKSFYMNGGVCTACPTASSHTKIGSTSIADCRSTCAANQ